MVFFTIIHGIFASVISGKDYVRSFLHIKIFGRNDSELFTTELAEELAHKDYLFAHSASKNIIPLLDLYIILLEYEKILNREKTREGVLQNFLKKYPILLEPISQEIMPKVKLGSEYETDFVIKYHDSSYTLIEIEKLEKSRDWVLNALTAENIGVGVHYLPVHLHPFYRKTFGWREGDFPNAEWIGERTISLPLSAALNDDDVQDVIIAFRKVLSVSK